MNKIDPLFLRFADETFREIPTDPIKKEHKAGGAICEKQSLNERLGEFAVATLQKISRENRERMEGYSEKPTLLNKGVFYANEYFGALEALSKQPLAEATSQAVKRRLESLTQSGAFFHGTAPSSHFRPEESAHSATGKKIATYLLKDKSIKPSEALDTILNGSGLIFLSCAEACQVAYYAALRNELGDEKFDILFGFDSPTPFSVGMGVENILNPMYLFIEDDLKPKSKPIAKGDWGFFVGPDIYTAKHLNGEGGNWNVLFNKSIDGTRSSIGLGLNPEGESDAEIELDFLREFNAKPMGRNGLTAKVWEKIQASYPKGQIEQAERIQDLQIELRHLRAHNGGKIVLVRRWNKERVQQLIDASPAEGLKLLEGWMQAHQKIAHTFGNIGRK